LPLAAGDAGHGMSSTERIPQFKSTSKTFLAPCAAIGAAPTSSLMRTSGAPFTGDAPTIHRQHESKLIVAACKPYFEEQAIMDLCSVVIILSGHHWDSFMVHAAQTTSSARGNGLKQRRDRIEVGTGKTGVCRGTIQMLLFSPEIF